MTGGIEVSAIGQPAHPPARGLPPAAAGPAPVAASGLWSRLTSSKAFLLVRGQFLTLAFLKFIGVGLVNTFNGVVLAWLYSLFLQPNVAFVVGYLTSVTISFFLNSWIVFQTTRTVRKYVKFVLSYVPNFLIQNLCVVVVYNLLGFHELIAYIVAAAVGVPVTFLMIKFFAFGAHRPA